MILGEEERMMAQKLIDLIRKARETDRESGLINPEGFTVVMVSEVAEGKRGTRARVSWRFLDAADDQQAAEMITRDLMQDEHQEHNESTEYHFDPFAEWYEDEFNGKEGG